MTTAFVDASALVQRYTQETGSALMRALEGPVVVSELSRVEVVAALWRKHRLGELDVADAAVLAAALRADLDGHTGARWAVMAVSSNVLVDAARLVARHDLRSGDAIQLASAVLARAAAPDCRTLVAFDVRLRQAAAREGFGLLPAEGRVPRVPG